MVIYYDVRYRLSLTNKGPCVKASASQYYKLFAVT